MLNTQKLLYVLPDLAYVTELLPDKKPYSFSIQSFKQINGEFLDEAEFKAENILKLINKLDLGEEYFLVLPDFLFTNTIVSVQETSDAKIKEKLTTETLPKMGLKDETHLIETVVLNQLKGTTRVQLSAIEKSVLSVFKVAVAEKDIKITGVAPLSWTVKSLVSLEPSISVLQLGTKLYTAQHYIGVDQTTTASIDQPENIIETIKTLKGAEPNIQTVYLCSNSILEEKLKSSLNKILPIQQMASKDAVEKIPSYVSQIIVATQKTLVIPDYSLPTFKLSKPSPEEKEQYAALLASVGGATPDDEDEVTAEIPKPQISPVSASEESDDTQEDSTTEEELPDIEDVPEEKPAEPDLPEIEDTETSNQDDKAEASSDLTAAGIAAGVGATTAAATTSAANVAAAASASDDTLTEDLPVTDATDTNTTDREVEPKPATSKTAQNETKTATPDSTTEAESPGSSATAPVVVGASKLDTGDATPATPEINEDDVLKQFAQHGETAVESSNNSKPIIKNTSGAKNMMKMILITTGVFVLTVAVGIGVGMAILKYSGNTDSSTPPIVEVEQPTPTPSPSLEPTPSASSAASLDKSAVSILVINATTKAGYAGQMKTKLETAEFESVDTGNAKGDYSDGTFVYLKEENAALQAALAEATDLELTATDSARVEDTSGKYDAVLVLAE